MRALCLLRAKTRTEAPVKLTRSQFLMLAVLITGTFVTVLNQTVVTPALPSIMKEMGINAATAQWLTTGFTLVNAIMIPITAYLVERFSTRRLFLSSMAIFAAGSLLAGWGPKFAVLLAGRLVQALGAGILMPMVMTVLVLSFPVDKRGTAMGIFGLVVAFAPAIGPTVAGIIIDHASWHIMFYIVAALAGAVIAAALLILKPQAPAHSTGATFDRPSVILSTLGFGGLLYGFSDMGASGVGLPAFAATLVGLTALAAFAYRQVSMEHPMLDVGVLESRKFLVATLIGMVVQASLLAAGILMPIYIQTLRGFSATVSGLVLLPGAVVMGAMGPVAGRLFDRHGPRRLVIAGMAGLSLSTAAFALLSVKSSLLYITALYLVRMFSLALVNMPVTTWGINSLDNRLISHGTAVNNTLRQVAGSLGTAIVISVSAIASSAGSQHLHMAEQAATLFGINVAFGTSAGLCLVGTLLAIALVKDRAGDAQAEDPANAHRFALESIMKPEAIGIRDNATVAEAVDMLTKDDLEAMPVLNGEGRAVGFISIGDVMRALSSRHDQQFMDPIVMIMQNATDGRSFEERIGHVMGMRVGELGSAGLVSVDVHAKLPDVCRVLGRNRLKRVPVMEDGRVVGVVSRADIARYALSAYAEARPDGARAQGREAAKTA